MRASRRLRAMGTAGAVVALGTVARADAPSGQYGLFDQDDDSITDAHTGLVWERYPASSNDAGLVQQEAFDYCAGLRLEGRSDWRVPSYKELLTLVDESPHLEYVDGLPSPAALDRNAFPQPYVGKPYWTSSSTGGTGQVYVVSFIDGSAQVSAASLAIGVVRCVH